MRYVDPDGAAINVVIGALVGFVSSSATEIGGRVIAGQSFGNAVKHAIKGEAQSFKELGATMTKGALSAALFSGVTQGLISSGTTTSGQVGNLLTGTMKDFNINQPQCAGSVGVMGESVFPTVIDLGKEANRVINTRE